MRIVLLLSLGVLAILSGIPPPAQCLGIVETMSSLKSNYSLTIILQALDPKGVFGDLEVVRLLNSNATQKTFFAPTDAAFNKAFQSISLTYLAKFLDEFGKYHTANFTVDQAYIDRQADLFFLPTLLQANGPTNSSKISPQVMRVSKTPSGLLLGGGTWWESSVVASFPADNGMLHVVNNTLTVPTTMAQLLGLENMTFPLVPSALNLTPNVLSDFTTYAGTRGIVQAIDNLLPVTLLLPTNKAMEAARITINDATGNDTERTNLLEKVIRFNIILGVQYTTQTGGDYPTLLNETMRVPSSSSPHYFGTVPIVQSLLLTNGVAHMVDMLVFPPSVNRAITVLKSVPDNVAPRVGAYLIGAVGVLLFLLGGLFAFAGWGPKFQKYMGERRRIKNRERTGKPHPIFKIYATPIGMIEESSIQYMGQPFIVARKHEPLSVDEIELYPGQLVEVKTIFRDGWCIALSVDTNQLGAVPLDCIRFSSSVSGIPEPSTTSLMSDWPRIESSIPSVIIRIMSERASLNRPNNPKQKRASVSDVMRSSQSDGRRSRRPSEYESRSIVLRPSHSESRSLNNRASESDQTPLRRSQSAHRHVFSPVQTGSPRIASPRLQERSLMSPVSPVSPVSPEEQVPEAMLDAWLRREHTRKHRASRVSIPSAQQPRQSEEGQRGQRRPSLGTPEMVVAQSAPRVSINLERRSRDLFVPPERAYGVDQRRAEDLREQLMKEMKAGSQSPFPQS